MSTFNFGAASAETIRVACMGVEPVASSAIIVNDGAPISFSVGDPYSLRLGESNESHVGDPERLYSSDPDAAVKVPGENWKSNGCDTRATGGTCELSGNDTIGAASMAAASSSVSMNSSMPNRSTSLTVGKQQPLELMRKTGSQRQSKKIVHPSASLSLLRCEASLRGKTSVAGVRHADGRGKHTR